MAPRKTIKKKVAAKKRKPIGKKKAAAKKTAPKRSPARKPATRKRAIAFEMMKSHQTAIEKTFEEMQEIFDTLGEDLNEYVYNGKKKNAAITRAQLMDLTKIAKTLRTTIQESKVKLKPIYK